MPDYDVTIPVSRLVEFVKMVDMQAFDACPPNELGCWQHRRGAQHFEGTLEQIKCKECWLKYLLTGC